MDSKAFFLLHICLISAVFSQPEPKWQKVTELGSVSFTYDAEVSDEFDESNLDLNKWSPHGIENENTGCPQWNGPVDWDQPYYSSYFATNTDVTGDQIKEEDRNYHVQNGTLRITLTSKPLDYFTQREYSCNSETFRCNNDENITCFGTRYDGSPILNNINDPTSYRYLIHDKCKMEPYCIPSPKHVTGLSRKYQRYVGVSLGGRKIFRYGFFEAHVKVARTSAVTAVWMHDNNVYPSYSRWTYDATNNFYRLESPTVVRSRRWQELDMLEAMNAEKNDLKRKWIPNIHVFAGYKGEFTRANLQEGNLGPIVLDRGVFTERNPKFTPPDPSRSNSYSMNYGSTKTLPTDWPDKWYTIGMYWSPEEIRFILDGEETFRIKNTLVHQPMFWTISTGINRPWAGRPPRDDEISLWSEIDYVRRWTVQTEGAQDPPSELPLKNLMENKFNSLGNSYYAVDGLFPVEDDGLSVPGPLLRMFIDAMSPSPNSNQSNYTNTNSNPTFQERDRGSTGRYKRMSEEEYKRQISREDRFRIPEEEPNCDLDGAVTVFENSNPETNLAGWATENGYGSDAGIVPMNQCRT